MSDAKPTDGGQNAQETLSDRIGGVDWTRLGTIAIAAVGGLIANSAVLLTIVGGDALGIADGVAYLAPVVVLGTLIHLHYNPIAGTPYLGPAALFVTLILANTVSLSVRVFRMGVGAQSQPAMTLLLLAFVALLFTPGAFLGVWATRRWLI